MNKSSKSAFALIVTFTSAIACVAPATNDTGAGGNTGGATGSTGGSAGSADCKIGEPCTPGAVCKSDKNIVCAPCLDMWLTKAKSDEVCSADSGAGGSGGTGGGSAILCDPGPCPSGYTCVVRNGKETCDPNGTGGTGGGTADLCNPGPCPSGFTCVVRNGKESCDPVSNGTGGASGTGGTTSTALRTLELHFTGNAAGSYSNHRYCKGSPVVKGAAGAETPDIFLAWPGQVLTSLNNDTWLELGNDVKSSTAEVVTTFSIPADTSFDFQCYDEKDGALIKWGCVDPATVGITVKENGANLSVALVQNQYGSKNCRVY